jgi:CRISPR-associated protein Cmr2
MNMPEPKDLVLLTFGPVQSFISASRRTQDLAVSSLILSSLANQGLNYVEKDEALSPIFPIQSTKTASRQLPNRMVFLAPEGQGETYAGELEKQIRKEWLDIADSVKDYLVKLISSDHWHSQWDQQVEEWLETYWVSVAWDGREETYAKSFETLNLGIDARKALRQFPTTPQPGKKCTLSGIRSAIGVNKQGDIWEEISSKVSRTALRETERLSAISAIKRFADSANIPSLKSERFPSTSSIAVASFKKHLLENWQEVEEPVNKFIGAINDLELIQFSQPEPFECLKNLMGEDASKRDLMRLEGDYFYPEFFTLENVNDNRKEQLKPLELNSDTTKVIRQAKDALSTILDKMAELAGARAVDTPRPNSYYAALVMDGDHMGEKLDQADSLEAHKAISQAMAKSAGEFKEIIEVDHPGILVYSGGDDVLALLPVNAALDAAQAVRDKFRANMKEIGLDADMSGGIAVMHHRSPLQAILTKARGAEYSAKEEFGRATLVLSIIKRSGEDLTAAMKWFTSPGVENPIADLLSHFSTGRISSKFAYDLRAEVPALQQNLEGFKLELKRLLNRHSDVGLAQEDFDDLRLKLIGFLDQMPPHPPEKLILRLVDWMMAARFLAKGERA